MSPPRRSEYEEFSQLPDVGLTFFILLRHRNGGISPTDVQIPWLRWRTIWFSVICPSSLHLLQETRSIFQKSTCLDNVHDRTSCGRIGRYLATIIVWSISSDRKSNLHQ
jgi:hypothetical protein